MLNNKSILITGGTGSFGTAFCNFLLKKYRKIKKIVIFSRDEFKQFEMEKKFPVSKYSCLRYFLGDVRDSSRLERALEGIDIVIHAAALKQVDKAENNPMEVIKTNILGAQNLIDGCLNLNVKNLIALSTDKASSPINLYGATKLCSDKLFISANNIKGSRKIKLSVVRYGNVLGSRGSVVPLFLENRNNSHLGITHPDMTRFSITLEEGVSFVDWCMNNNKGREVFVPKIPSFKILDLARVISPKSKIKYIGIRPGEKIHEELISLNESYRTLENQKMYFILNGLNEREFNEYKKFYKAKNVPKNFSFQSNNNSHLLNKNQIYKLIVKNFNTKF